MTAICMVVGGPRARRDEILREMLAEAAGHGKCLPGFDDEVLVQAVCANNADASYHEDDATAVLVAGYLTAVGADGHLECLDDASPARWFARQWRQRQASALDAVDGDYAVVVLDKRSRRLYAIAGPTVIYPLFVARHPEHRDMWVLGSEPGLVLRAAGLQGRMNARVIAQHLFYLGALLDPEQTPYLGVKRVPAGAVACWRLDDLSGYELKYFWRPEEIELRAGGSRSELLGELYAAIEESVLRALPTPGRTVLALSGGMDSSSIWAVLRHQADGGDRVAKAVTAYSFLYPGTPSDEQTFIDENHRFWGTCGCYRDIAGLSIVDADDYLLSRQDYPLSGSTAYVLKTLAEDLAAGGADTLLAGFSGDFWLNPPWSYQADLLRSGELRAALTPVSDAWRQRQVTTAEALRWLARILLPRGSRARRRLRPLKAPLGMTKAYRYLADEVEQWFEAHAARLGFAKAQMLFARETQWGRSYIPLTTVQLLGRKGIVLRDPLGSRTIMEWALSVPTHQIADPIEKGFLRQAMSHRLPPMVRDKHFPTFHGGDPERRHEPFRDLGNPRDWLICQAGLLAPDVLLAECERGGSRYDLRLERFAMTEAFCRRHFS